MSGQGEARRQRMNTLASCRNDRAKADRHDAAQSLDWPRLRCASFEMMNKRSNDGAPAQGAGSAQSGNDPSTIEHRWPSLSSSERLTMLRSVALTESIFARAHWDELPMFARLALQLRYDGAA